MDLEKMTRSLAKLGRSGHIRVMWQGLQLWGKPGHKMKLHVERAEESKLCPLFLCEYLLSFSTRDYTASMGLQSLSRISCLYDPEQLCKMRRYMCRNASAEFDWPHLTNPPRKEVKA